MNSRLTLIILGIFALIFIPVLISVLINSSNVSQVGRATTCNSNECSTSSGCQLRGYSQDGYICIGSNKWQGPDGRQMAGSPQGPIVPADQTGAMPDFPSQTSQTSQTAPVNNLETAKRVIKWIDTQKNAKGVYLNGECRDNPGCFQPIEDPKVAHYVIWARYQAFKHTGDPYQLSQLGTDLSNFTSLYDVPNHTIAYLNNLHVCSLLYPVAIDNSIPSDQQNSLGDLCSKSMFVGDVVDEANTLLSNNQGIAEPDVEKVLRGELLALDQNTDAANYRRGYFQYAVFASDLAAQYLWFSDVKQLQRAKHVFSKGLQIYSHGKNSGILRRTGDAALALAAADLYAATKDSKYQNFISTYISEKQANGCVNTEDCAYYLLSLSRMYSNTNNQSYLQQINSVINNLMLNAYDSSVGAFHQMTPRMNMKIFDARANSILSGILFSL